MVQLSHPYMTTEAITIALTNHKLESRLLGEISTASDLQMIDTTIMAESEEELKSLLRVEEEIEKAVLKHSIKKNKIMASGPITSWQIDGENVENSVRLHFLGLQNHCEWWFKVLLPKVKAGQGEEREILKKAKINLFTTFRLW